MCRNITSLTTLKIRRDQTDLLWNMLCNTCSLNLAEFEKGQQLLDEVYNNLKESLNIENDIVMNFLKKRQLIVYIKRIFIGINRGDMQDLRRVSKIYFKKYGYLNIIGIIYVVSLFGPFVIGFLPKLYEMFNRIFSRRKLNDATIALKLGYVR